MVFLFSEGMIGLGFIKDVESRRGMIALVVS
jgi:hypothetical protein